MQKIKSYYLSTTSSNAILWCTPPLIFESAKKILERAVPWCGIWPNSGDVYNPAFVRDIRRADKVEPEATFDNSEDMMNWLDNDGTNTK